MKISGKEKKERKNIKNKQKFNKDRIKFFKESTPINCIVKVVATCNVNSKSVKNQSNTGIGALIWNNLVVTCAQNVFFIIKVFDHPMEADIVYVTIGSREIKVK